MTSGKARKYRKLPLAEHNDRVLNHVIDSLCIVILLFIRMLILDVVLGIEPDSYDWIEIVTLYVLFYTLFEYFTGRTPGKYYTKNEVVLIDGSRPGFFAILGRSLTRIIFLDTISFLFSKRGWHDYFSNTYVISKKPQTSKKLLKP